MHPFFKLALALVSSVAFAAATAQPLFQSIRGQVSDDISKAPILGATVALVDDPARAVMTDSSGWFTLPKTPVGRQSILVSAVGYQSSVIQEILVTSGKEVVLDISLAGRIGQLDEVIVKGSSKRALNNEMVSVSGQSFRAEDASRYAGALGDPSRMVAGFAGVSSSNDSRNDIIVRGNSPYGLLWQIDGIDVPNPNHYGSLSSTGGPVSILNNNNLGKSDFLTGAFPAQYGNALGSVFDLRLRTGNMEKAEFLTEVSFTGFEFGAEGPLSSKHQSSYIVNYRYSTLGVLNTVGLNFGTGKAVPQYQDVNFKFVLPLGRQNRLTFFGLGGPSRVSFLGKDADSTNLYGDADENLFTHYFTGITGATMETHFNSKTLGQLRVGFSHTLEKIAHDSISAVDKLAYRDEEHQYTTSRVSLSYELTHKFDLKNSIIIGTHNTLFYFNLFDRRIYEGGTRKKINLDGKGQLALLQGYVEAKHRFSDPFSLNAGIHVQSLTLNGAFSLEPRLGVRYVTTQRNVLAFGYGLHAQMQSPLVYFYQTPVPGGGIAFTNKNLGFTRNQHLVGSYDYSLTRNMHLKTEVYYQLITAAPVEQRPTSFSLLNEGAGFGDDKKDSLLNTGTGRNYGVEWSLEKYFTKGTYFLVTASLFDSKYKGSDGIERNTAFNTKYAFNILAGKDFKVGKKNNTLSANVKLGRVGGKFVSPIDVAASQQEHNTVYDETVAPFSVRLPPYFRMDVKVGYRKNSARSTLEFGIDLENVTMHDNVFIRSYNATANRIVNEYQQGFLPVPYFKLTF